MLVVESSPLGDWPVPDRVTRLMELDHGGAQPPGDRASMSDDLRIMNYSSTGGYEL